jgi:hypothetical protein
MGIARQPNAETRDAAIAGGIREELKAGMNDVRFRRILLQKSKIARL